MIRNSLLIFILILGAACAPANQAPSFSQPVTFRLDSKLKILDESYLQTGGIITAFRFKAGAGIISDHRLDGLADEMINGFSQTVDKKSSSLQVVAAESVAQLSPWSLEGHIIEWREPSFWKKVLWWQPRYMSLTVQGRLVNQTTKEPMAVFMLEHQRRQDQATLKVLAYELGVKVAHFILGDSK